MAQTSFTKPQLTIEPKSLKIGDYQLLALPTGIFGLDGGAMFGTVPKVLWEKNIPPDSANRIPMEARALLLRNDREKKYVLIDCGNGSDFVEKYGEKLGLKFAQMYNVDKDAGIENALARLGLSTKNITDVILTHLHFDHAGGATTWSKEKAKLVPTFANARYYVQEENLKTARAPNIREKASYFAANFAPLEEAGVLNVLRGNTENVLPGISVFVSNGHTRGQQLVRIHDGKTTMVYCGDLVPTSSHIRLAWIMGYDLDPLKLIEEKQNLLRQAAASGWYLYFEHDPYHDFALVKADGSDFAIQSRYVLNS